MVLKCSVPCSVSSLREYVAENSAKSYLRSTFCGSSGENPFGNLTVDSYVTSCGEPNGSGSFESFCSSFSSWMKMGGAGKTMRWFFRSGKWRRWKAQEVKKVWA